MSLSRHARRCIAVAAAVILVPLLLAACNVKSGGFVISLPAHLRFVNVLVDGGPLTVNVAGNTVVTGLPFEAFTGYNDVNAGTQEVQIIANGTSTIYDNTQLFVDSTSYTFFVYGTSAAPVVIGLPDLIVNTPGSGVFALRIFNAAYASGAIDVYITTPGVPLDNQSPNFSNLAYGNVTLFNTINAGSYQVRFTLPNSKQVIYDAGVVAFSEQTSYQIAAYTKGSTTLLNAEVLSLDSAGSGATVNNKLAQFKLIHAAPGTTPVNAFVDGVTALANLPYQGASSYETLPAGTHLVTVETVATPGAVIASAQPPFAPATDASIVLTGTLGAQTMFVLSDMNLPGSVGNARIRFVNAASNVGPVDVYVNFAPVVTSVPTNAAAPYIEFPENTYAITFNVAGTTTLLLNLPAVAVTAGRTYTLYLVGTTGALSYVQTRDD